MKVIYYSPHPSLNLQALSGSGTHMRAMIRAFEALGHTVIPLIMGGEAMKEVTNIDYVQTSFLKRFTRQLMPTVVWESLKDYRLLHFDAKAEQRLEELVKKEQPDLIYERSNYMQVSGVRVAKRHGVRHVLEVNSPYLEERVVLQGKSWWMKRAIALEQQQLNTTDKIVVVSSALKEYFIKRYNLEATRFIVTPNAIDLTQAAVVDSQVEQWRQNYKLEDRLVIGFVGSVLPWQRVDLLIEAFVQLRATGQQARLLIVGGGELIEELQEQAQHSGYNDDILFVGRVLPEAVFEHIALMDIAVLANTAWYCSPIKLFEYGLMGKAIVAPKTAPIQEIMNADVDGVLIEPRVEALTHALKGLCEDATLRERLGTHFQQKVQTVHTWNANAQQVLHHLEVSN